MTVTAILLAAGASSRMRGVDKLTEPVRGTPLLRDRALMLNASLISSLVVVLPDEKTDRVRALDGVPCKRVTNAAALTGMASSIIAGLTALEDATTAALVMPGDMPDLTRMDIDRLITAHQAAPDRIMRATDHAGNAGSPVIFPRSFFADLMALEANESGRTVLKTYRSQVDHIGLPGTNATLDLDTPEAWAAWRARNPR